MVIKLKIALYCLVLEILQVNKGEETPDYIQETVSSIKSWQIYTVISLGPIGQETWVVEERKVLEAQLEGSLLLDHL